MMALARGEMPYGQFVQEDTLIGIRTAAAIRPLLRKLEVIGSHLTHRWREMDSNDRYPAKFLAAPVDPPTLHLAI
jgi:hypothetical protein